LIIDRDNSRPSPPGSTIRDRLLRARPRWLSARWPSPIATRLKSR